MSAETKEVFGRALSLPPVERAMLIERLFQTFISPDREEIDSLWAREAEERIDAFERGEAPSCLAEDVFQRIK